MHAAWALGEIGRRIAAGRAPCSVDDMRRVLETAAGDVSAEVREEAAAALALMV
jgi:hypothetical protein